MEYTQSAIHIALEENLLLEKECTFALNIQQHYIISPEIHKYWTFVLFGQSLGHSAGDNGPLHKQR